MLTEISGTFHQAFVRGLDEQVRRAVGMNDGESQRRRYVWDVGPADIEGPCNGVSLRQDVCIGVAILQPLGDCRQLVRRALPGKLQRLELDGA